MPRYKGPPQKQINPGDPYGKFNCSAYCLALLITNVTAGGVSIDGETVRKMSNEPKPDPKSPGLNIAQLDAVAAKLLVHFYDKTGGSWANVMSYVSSRDVLVQVDYASLGQYRAQPGGDFGHALLLLGRRVTPTGAEVYVYDPLRPKYIWIPASVVERAAVKFARDTQQVQGIRFAVGNPVPNII